MNWAQISIMSLIMQTHQIATTHFDSMNEAGVKALEYSHQQSEYYEYGGVIVQGPDGKFTFSDPVTDYAGDHVGVDQDPEHYPKDVKIVAGYHSHACLPHTHVPAVLSPDDLSNARTLNKPEYMLDMCTGDVHYWAPGDPTEMVEYEQVAKGKIVGHVAVSGKELESK